MKKEVDLCVDCTAVGLHCRGEACDYFKPVTVIVCAKCGEELDDVYDVDGEELCEDCLRKMFRRDG